MKRTPEETTALRSVVLAEADLRCLDDWGTKLAVFEEFCAAIRIGLKTANTVGAVVDVLRTAATAFEDFGEPVFSGNLAIAERLLDES